MIAELISSFLTSVPGVALLGIGVVTLWIVESGHFSGKPLNQGSLIPLRVLGYTIISFGALLIVILFWEQAAAFRADFAVWFPQALPTIINVLIVLAVVTVVLLVVRSLKIWYQQKGFAVRLTPVAEFGEAFIRVTNSGRGTPCCVARITRIQKMPRWGGERPSDLNLDVVLPTLPSLLWNRSTYEARIKGPNYSLVNLVQIDHDRNQRIVTGRHTWGYDLNDDSHMFEVVVFSVEKRRLRPLAKVEGILRMNEDQDLVWERVTESNI